MVYQMQPDHLVAEDISREAENKDGAQSMAFRAEA